MMTISYNTLVQKLKELLYEQLFDGRLSSSIYFDIGKKTDMIVTAVFVDLRTTNRDYFNHYSFNNLSGFL